MSQAYVMTIPRTVPKRALKIMIQKNDVHKWTIGFETGSDGYEHYQVRLVASNDNFFEWCKAHIPTAHIEKSNTEEANYERKSGNFISSTDTSAIRQIRYGTLRPLQRKILEEVKNEQRKTKRNPTGDRKISVYYDPKGNHGKTWLSLYLYERGTALLVPRSKCSADRISAYICSSYNGEEFIIIDIPRSRKLDAGMYEALEEIKDGMVFDDRYHGRCRNIRGVLVIVFTNKMLDTKKLSQDRWCLHGIKHDKV